MLPEQTGSRNPDRLCGAPDSAWNVSLGERMESLRSQPSYLLTFETQAMLARLAPGRRIPGEMVHRYERALLAAFQLGVDVPVIPLAYQELYAPLEKLLDDELAQAKETGRIVVNFDRFIGIGRRDEGALVTMSFGRMRYPGETRDRMCQRQGDAPIEEQFAYLEHRAAKLGTRNLVLVDDGVSTIETTESYLEEFERHGFRVVRIVAGVVPEAAEGDWATRQYLEDRGIEVVPVITIAKPLDWVCARDGNIFGGKNMPIRETLSTDQGEVPLIRTAAYFLPFSDGASASFDPTRLAQVSRALLEANDTLFTELKQLLGTNRITLRYFAEHGFSLPTSALGILPDPTPEMDVQEYNNWCRRAAQAYTPDLAVSFTPAFQEDRGNEPYLDDLYPELQNRVTIICAPSGCGRTTVMRKIMKERPSAAWVRRTTSRRMREGETPTEIECTTREIMQRAVAEGDMLSVCKYMDQLYGVRLSELRKQVANGASELYVEGTIEVMGLAKRLRTALVVVMLPDSQEAFAQRIAARDGNDDETNRRATTSIGHLEVYTQNLQAMLLANKIHAVVINYTGNPDGAVVDIMNQLGRWKRYS
ncbi:MAG: hypothetical protein N2691_04285 [Patescibacteria group bacterium]|nr:hypothetical protein [Patescibacteria group bacterium]